MNGLLVILRMGEWRAMECGGIKMGRSISGNGKGIRRMDMGYISLGPVDIKVDNIL